MERVKTLERPGKAQRADTAALAASPRLAASRALAPPKTRAAGAKLLLGAWIAAVIAAAFVYVHPAAGFVNPSLARMMFFHVPNAIAADAVSALSAWFALRYLVTGRWLDDARSRVLASLALALWLMTVVTGAVFAKVQWGVYWNWDPRESSILILLLVYMAYFALRSAIPDARRQAAAAAGYTLFAAATVPFLSYILPNSTQSLHPRGVLFTSDGMDAQYHLIFWSAVAGFLGLTAWLYEIGLRSERIARGVERRLERAARVGA